MFVWFLVIGLGGAWQIWLHPSILVALSPVSAIKFFMGQPVIAFIAMSAVMLAITGVEALYADMGHFGRAPIAKAWFLLVFPALLLCYMGQGALLLHNPATISNPLFLLYPESLRFTIVILATFATLIASQSVISGAFSLTRQAVHLGFLPKMIIRHTSSREVGQVYLPFVNVALYVVVSLLVLIFGTSQKLAGAYGMAVSITLAIDTILFIVVARTLWRKSIAYITVMLIVFMSIDILFVTANLSKLFRGGWFPLTLAALILVIITTWIKGQRIIIKKRKSIEGPLQDFIEEIRHARPPITRVPGQAVYIGHHADLAPLALHATVEKLHELHETAIIVSAEITNASHIPEDERVSFNALRYQDGISHVHLRFGFHDSPNIPKALKAARNLSPELEFDPETVEYFISQTKIVITKRPNMVGWRKSLYGLMARNALSASDYYKLTTDRTVEIRSLIEL
jgi:KUP system potassium uptake protein